MKVPSDFSTPELPFQSVLCPLKALQGRSQGGSKWKEARPPHRWSSAIWLKKCPLVGSSHGYFWWQFYAFYFWNIHTTIYIPPFNVWGLLKVHSDLPIRSVSCPLKLPQGRSQGAVGTGSTCPYRWSRVLRPDNSTCRGVLASSRQTQHTA